MTNVKLMVAEKIKDDRIPSNFKSDLKFAIKAFAKSRTDLKITKVKCFLTESIMVARHESIKIPIIVNSDGEYFWDTVKVIGYQELKANG